MNDLVDVAGLTTEGIEALFELTDRMKRDPESFAASLPKPDAVDAVREALDVDSPRSGISATGTTSRTR